MPRVRQFSSQRNELSKSQLSLSRHVLNSPNLNNSKLQKHQFATPKTDKQISHSSHQQQSSSRRSDRSSHSEYICIGCFNDQMASDKKRQRRQELLRQKEREKLDQQALLRLGHTQKSKYSQFQKQSEKTSEFNRKMMEQKRQQKAREQQIKIQQSEMERKEQENLLLRQKQRSKEKQELKEKYRKEINQQISQKKKRQAQQSQQEKKEKQRKDELFGKGEQQYFNQKARKQQLYRQELFNQIKQREQLVKKQQTDKKNTQTTEIGITEAAHQREIDRKQKTSERQQQLLQEAKKRSKLREIELMEQKLSKKRDLEQRIREQQNRELVEQKYREEKQRQTDAYLDELRNHIEMRKIKQRQRYNELIQASDTSLKFEDKVVSQNQCRSCEKQYPKAYLTKIS